MRVSLVLPCWLTFHGPRQMATNTADDFAGLFFYLGCNFPKTVVLGLASNFECVSMPNCRNSYFTAAKNGSLRRIVVHRTACPCLKHVFCNWSVLSKITHVISFIICLSSAVHYRVISLMTLFSEVVRIFRGVLVIVWQQMLPQCDSVKMLGSDSVCYNVTNELRHQPEGRLVLKKSPTVQVRPL